MKYAKKMIMVPEAEYLALLDMLNRGSNNKSNTSNGDYLQEEKANTEARMYTTLRNPKISEEVKSKKHDLLYKQRRKLKNIIENKPQKVVIEQSQNTTANTSSPQPSSYLGVSPPKDNTSSSISQQFKETPHHEKYQKINTIKTFDEAYDDNDNDDDDGDDDDDAFVSPSTTSSAQRNIIHQPYYIKKEFYGQLLDHVKKNAKNLGVMNDGRILTYQDQPIEDSDYVQHLKYISEQSSTPSRGKSFFMARLQRDELYKHLNQLSYHDQEGSGRGGRGGRGGGGRKRVIIRINSRSINKGLYKKTPGLNREIRQHNQQQQQKTPSSSSLSSSTFRPKLWAKLAV
jgi:hypothetical protein